jgi:hypothetical protein
VPTAMDVVDGEVRELIRRRGLDPFTDPAPVRATLFSGKVVNDDWTSPAEPRHVAWPGMAILPPERHRLCTIHGTGVRLFEPTYVVSGALALDEGDSPGRGPAGGVRPLEVHPPARTKAPASATRGRPAVRCSAGRKDRHRRHLPRPAGVRRSGRLTGCGRGSG